MSQLFPSTAQIIYDTLTGDAEFMEYLGTYNFRSSEDPQNAISIVSPGADLPLVRNVNGLECVIQDTGDIDRKDYISGESDFNVTYSVFLIAWNGATGQDMTDATQRIMKIFGGAKSFETVATTDGLGSLVQTLIRIPSMFPILVNNP